MATRTTWRVLQTTMLLAIPTHQDPPLVHPPTTSLLPHTLTCLHLSLSPKLAHRVIHRAHHHFLMATHHPRTRPGKGNGVNVTVAKKAARPRLRQLQPHVQGASLTSRYRVLFRLVLHRVLVRSVDSLNRYGVTHTRLRLQSPSHHWRLLSCHLLSSMPSGETSPLCRRNLSTTPKHIRLPTQGRHIPLRVSNRVIIRAV